MIFFERPFWCYDSIFIYNPEQECHKDIVLSFSKFNVGIHRSIEIFLLIYFITIQYFRNLIRDQTSTNKIRTVVTYFIIFAVIIDISISLLFNSFPFVNFLIRPSILVLVSRRIREEWTRVMKVFYNSKKMLMLFIFSIVCFGAIGNILMGKSYDLTEEQVKINNFNTFFGSIKNMFILLTAAFPNMMLIQFSFGRKWTFIFFMLYYLVIVYLIVGLVKSQYFYTYVEQNKKILKKFISLYNNYKLKVNESTVNNVLNKMITVKHIEKVVGDINLKEEEHQKIEAFLNEISSDLSKLYREFLNLEKIKHEKIKAQKDNYSFYIRLFKNKYLEFFFGISNFSLMLLNDFFPEQQIYFHSFQLVLCLYYLFEYIIYIRIYTFVYFTKNFKVQTFYRLIVIVYILMFIPYCVLFFTNHKVKTFTRIIQMMTIILCTRLFLLLNLFKEYKMIFKIVRSMRSVFYSLILTQFSFFFYFSTFTMIILGGKVKIGEFNDNPEIPNFYYYLNFNDFSFSFLSCFTMMIKMNMDVVMAFAKVSTDFMTLYFCIFYFIGVNLVLNICQTYILSMYFNLQKDKKIKK